MILGSPRSGKISNENLFLSCQEKRFFGLHLTYRRAPIFCPTIAGFRFENSDRVKIYLLRGRFDLHEGVQGIVGRIRICGWFDLIGDDCGGVGRQVDRKGISSRHRRGLPTVNSLDPYRCRRGVWIMIADFH